MSSIMLLENVQTWPKHVVDYLDKYHDVFLSWELKNHNELAPLQYDYAMQGFQDVLRTETEYVLTGYHCTRLTEPEVQSILENGMQLPNLEFLKQRINSLKQAGMITVEVAEYLQSKNRAGDDNRAGKLWFCFYHPYLAGERGIERFFRSWGGEALYGNHEKDELSGPVLKILGIPCIVEIHVSLANLAERIRIASQLVGRYLTSCGIQKIEIYNYEDYVKQPISKQSISRIVKFPDAEFIEMTKCDTWKSLLMTGS